MMDLKINWSNLKCRFCGEHIYLTGKTKASWFHDNGLSRCAQGETEAEPYLCWFTCKAKEAGSAGGNTPQDCDWPGCGCDTYADKVIESLQESGAFEKAAEAEIRRLRQELGQEMKRGSL